MPEFASGKCCTYNNRQTFICLTIIFFRLISIFTRFVIFFFNYFAGNKKNDYICKELRTQSQTL